MKLKSLFIIAAVFSTLVADAQTSEYSFKETYKVGADAQLKVASSDGNIEVVPSSGSDIEVFYRVKRMNGLLKMNRKELEKELILTVTHTGNTLDISIRYPKESWSWKSADRIYVNFEIHVPAQTSADLNTSDGNVSISGLKGNQKIKTSDGNISVEKIAGDVVAGTSDGNVTVADVKGSAQISTSDGNINLTNIGGDASSTTSDGDIEINKVIGSTYAKTSDGHINFRELSGSFTGYTSDGNIRGNLVELKKELTAKTGDGNISISIPARLGLDLDIKGEHLDVPLDNFSGESDEDHIRGKSNGGGIPVNLSTSDGNITLTYK